MSDEAPIGTAVQFFAASFRAVESPQDLTPHDFTVLNSTHEGRGLAACARRKAAAWHQKAAEALRRAAAPAATTPAATKQTATQLLLDGAFTEAWKDALGGKAGEGSRWAQLIVTHANVPVTMAALDLLVAQAMFFHHGRLKALADEIATLKQQLAALEQRPVGAAYKGVWRADVKYERDEMVTCSGSCWIARVENISTRPGTAPHCWVLAVKAGKDAR